MERSRYRLNKPTLAILTQEGDRIAVRIPRNSIVWVPDESDDQQPLIEVEWEGNRILMFTVDLRERGVPMRNRSAAGSPSARFQ